MASGSSGRNNSPSKGFDFAASDDILCSYEDYGNQDDAINATHSDPAAILTNSNKEFNKSRMARSAVHPAPAYGTIDESSNHEMMNTIEKTMKRHSDNLTRFLEGLSSRLSQLELYCYNVDKSIGELRSDLVHDHGEQDSKLKSLEKHLQEVHRSVQVLRDKQELADTQKELAKLQLAQKEPSDIHSHQNKDRPPQVQSVSSESKKPEIMPDLQNQQLALALSHQVTSRPPEQHQHQPIGPPLNTPQTQPTSYYIPSQPIQAQFMPSSEPQYRANQPPQYQQWSTQQIITPQIRPQTANPGYTINPSPADTIPYGFNGPVRTVQSPPHPSLPPNTYVIYESEGGGGPRTYRPSQPTHFQQGSYTPTSSPIQNQQPNQMNRPGPPQYVRSHHQYGDIIEKTILMGYRGDHVAAVIQRLEENGQPVDFNGVLDRLNGQQRGAWAG
ncbi:uncharacterized protein LOC124917525 [Impatiens glandulifera]|uniref:uncharacterized protein LOC124917525 n=1 Tax=Impatiens glandulifera TaxID=253017 RepID=UPI001FB11DAB|nr:uncharacterized protein LOC124917525 [Impatiens glandulifera]